MSDSVQVEELSLINHLLMESEESDVTPTLPHTSMTSFNSHDQDDSDSDSQGDMYILYMYDSYIMNHGSGSYVGMTRKKHGRLYIKADRIFAENSLPVHFGAPKTAYLTSTSVFRYI